jgi:hypothetical protein
MADFTPDSTVILPTWARTLATLFLNKGLSWVAGAFVAWGLLPSDQTSSFINLAVGICLAGIGILWSIVKERTSRKRVIDAATGAPSVVTNTAGDVLAVPGGQ